MPPVPRSLLTLVPVLLLLAAPVRAQAPAQQWPVPDWARGMIWYKLIIDRFENGDPANDPTARDLFGEKARPWDISPWTGNWYMLSVKERMSSERFYDNAFLRQYGGDLEGLRTRLGYLKSLGVTGLQLSPVFESTSSHKFDAHSFHHVDSRLGPRGAADTSYLHREQPDNPKSWYMTAADRKFIEVVHAAHDSDMKVIVDVQFAHVSVNFWAFRDLLEKQERSAFASWFYVDEWDRPETPFASEFSYRSMFGVNAFPVLRKDSLGLVSGPREYVFAAVRRWMDPNGDGDPSDGVDGWRIELSHELSLLFWEQFIGFVKSVNPACLVIGAPHPESPKGKRLFDIEETNDFARLATKLLIGGRCTPTGFESGMAEQRASMESGLVDAQINWIDNHETDRLASMCVNPGLAFETMNSFVVNPSYLIRKPKASERATQRLLLLLQYTYPGSPVLYYGDEAGMWGGDDPDCRKPMLWPEHSFEPECAVELNGDPVRYENRFDSTVFSAYSTLLALRAAHVALRAGAMSTFLIDDERGLFGYTRHAGADRVSVVFNAGDTRQDCLIQLAGLPEGLRIDAPLQGLTYYYDRDGLALTIPPRTGLLLIPAQ